MSNANSRIIPQNGEVFFVEVNNENPFALRNVTEVLNNFSFTEERNVPCADGKARDFFRVDQRTFFVFLRGAQLKRKQYTLWHTTLEEPLASPYGDEGETGSVFSERGRVKYV